MADAGRAGEAPRQALNGAQPPFEWGVVTRALSGEQVSGDRAVVAANGNRALVAAIDGLGHGPHAAHAAQAAAQVLESLGDADVVEAAERCHEALRTTRGAAISLASFTDEPPAMTWLGVGSVEGRLVPSRARNPRHESLLLRAGVAGQALPPLTPATLSVERGDLLVFATDGIRGDFADALVVTGTCSSIAQRVLTRHGRQTDDALVVVVRYLGSVS